MGAELTEAIRSQRAGLFSHPTGFSVSLNPFSPLWFEISRKELQIGQRAGFHSISQRIGAIQLELAAPARFAHPPTHPPSLTQMNRLYRSIAIKSLIFIEQVHTNDIRQRKITLWDLRVIQSIFHI